jgi:PEP-CTERM motif
MAGFGIKAAVAAAAIVASAGMAQASHAAIVDWTVTGGTFDDGGTFSGTFAVNTNNDKLKAWNITTSYNGDELGETYATNSFFIPSGDGGGYPAFWTLAPYGPVADVLSLTNVPFLGSGTVSSLTGTEGAYFLGFDFVEGRNITGGTAVGVIQAPEPATWVTMIIGIGLLGAARRRRRSLTPA